MTIEIRRKQMYKYIPPNRFFKTLRYICILQTAIMQYLNLLIQHKTQTWFLIEHIRYNVGRFKTYIDIFIFTLYFYLFYFEFYHKTVYATIVLFHVKLESIFMYNIIILFYFSINTLKYSTLVVIFGKIILIILEI